MSLSKPASYPPHMRPLLTIRLLAIVLAIKTWPKKLELLLT